MTKNAFTVCIIGLGLMGGSLSLALRSVESSTFNVQRIIGVTRNRGTLEAAQLTGAIDAGTSDLAEGARDADVVVLATPARTILRQIPEIGRHARPGALILDLGSTKSAICAAMEVLPDGLQPVGGHPMCGKETAGFAAADAALFRGKIFVLCPLPRTAPQALNQAKALAEAIGACPVVLDPQAHDQAVAAISHLPYAAAVALVNAVAAGDNSLAWGLAASGFRDTSRVAASDVDMMLDVLLTNRTVVLDWLDAYASQLAALRAALDSHDETSLRAQLAKAQARRASLRF